jgi:hypothetical protein
VAEGRGRFRGGGHGPTRIQRGRAIGIPVVVRVAVTIVAVAKLIHRGPIHVGEGAGIAEAGRKRTPARVASAGIIGVGTETEDGDATAVFRIVLTWREIHAKDLFGKRQIRDEDITQAAKFSDGFRLNRRILRRRRLQHAVNRDRECDGARAPRGRRVS